MSVTPAKNLFVMAFLLFGWFSAVILWWIILPVTNFIMWNDDDYDSWSFDEYFDFLAKEFAIISKTARLKK